MNSTSSLCSSSNPQFQTPPTSNVDISGCAVPANDTGLVGALDRCCHGTLPDKTTTVAYNFSFQPYYSVFPQTKDEPPFCYAICTVNVRELPYTDVHNISRCLDAAMRNESLMPKSYCGGAVAQPSGAGVGLRVPGWLGCAVLALALAVAL